MRIEKHPGELGVLQFDSSYIFVGLSTQPKIFEFALNYFLNRGGFCRKFISFKISSTSKRVKTNWSALEHFSVPTY